MIANTRISIIGTPSQSMPVGLRRQHESRRHTGRGDLAWTTKFTTKFSRTPDEAAPLVAPKGAPKPLDAFFDRVAELDYLIDTQHLELATLRSELAANGMASVSLSEAPEDDMEAANLADMHLNQTPYAVRTVEGGEERVRDMVWAAAMTRRIDWERYITGCGPVHKARFTATAEGALGIVYDGPSRDADFIMEMKRALKYGWIDRFGALPATGEVQDGRAFCAHYEGKAVLAHMTDEQYAAYKKSRKYGDEDPDPLRCEFHAEDLRGRDDVGYAGPRGQLGFDDDDLAVYQENSEFE